MRTRVQRWGNSLALRIPRSVAAESRVREGSEVDLVVRRGKIVVFPHARGYRLADLLRRVTGDNVHAESWADDPVGREAW